MVTKIIWILWFQGWAGAPDLYKKCRESWTINNPTWKVISLDNTNIHEYIGEEKAKIIKSKTRISLTKQSDMLRLFLLSEHGGIWVDASTYCYDPLDDWLPVSDDFFAFRNPGPGRPLANWLIYAEKESKILEKFLESYLKWWTTHNDDGSDYFIQHHIFQKLLDEDNEFRERWESYHAIPASAPLSIILVMGLYPATDVNLRKVPIAPVYKLTVKDSYARIVSNSLFDLCSKGVLNQKIKEANSKLNQG
jgi:hypothetical protein